MGIMRFIFFAALDDTYCTENQLVAAAESMGK